MELEDESNFIDSQIACSQVQRNIASRVMSAPNQEVSRSGRVTDPRVDSDQIQTFVCDGCDIEIPENSPRFKCTVCVDFDLCDSCFEDEVYPDPHTAVSLLPAKVFDHTSTPFFLSGSRYITGAFFCLRGSLAHLTSLRSVAQIGTAARQIRRAAKEPWLDTEVVALLEAISMYHCDIGSIAQHIGRSVAAASCQYRYSFGGALLLVHVY